MKISYNWLKRYLDTDVSVQEIEKILTAIGLEVESLEQVEEIPGGLQGVVVGEVVECGKHPGADKLSVTKVNVGGQELLNIVCGAPNVAAGQKVLVATVGTTLTFSNGETLKLKRSKIRGEESMGMICAEDELGIGESHEGIMVLPQETKVGLSAKEYLNLETDTILEIGLTPNRIDAASHIGVARDLNAYLKFHGFNSNLEIPSVTEFDNLPRSLANLKPITVKLEAPSGSPRYYGITIDNIKVAPSPDWLQKAVRSIGLRPINNVVDITNFVLHETGHPLHAFDYHKIEGQTVVVRRANIKEKFKTLDGVERELSSEDLMICDQNKPMCIGGVFGGEYSGVSESTTAIFLESAYFNPVSIRKSSKRHSLKTDASFRFERGANPEILTYAVKRATQLLVQVTGAKVVGDIVKCEGEVKERSIISLNYDRMESLIGKKIGKESILSILKYLDFEILKEQEGSCEVAAPLYRVDVTRECDVVEEVLRIYGYNNIELPERMSASLSPGVKPDPERIRELCANLLVNNGFYETMNNSLTKGEYYSKLTTFASEYLVKLLNPLSSDLNSMRQTLLINGLEVISYNINHQTTELKIFEFGNVYKLAPEINVEAKEEKTHDDSEEKTHDDSEEKIHDTNKQSSVLLKYSESSKLSLFVTGQGQPYWRGKRSGGSYFMLKGYLEVILKRFGIDLLELEYDNAPADIFAEGLTIKTRGGKPLAIMGTISAPLLKKFDIKQAVYGAEISWDILLNQAKKRKVLYKELPKYPEVTRDLALLIDESVSYAAIRKCAFAVEKKLLKEVVLFDVYRGDKIPTGKKQYAISFTLQDSDKTLTDKYVEDVMNKLLAKFMNDFGATLR